MKKLDLFKYYTKGISCDWFKIDFFVQCIKFCPFNGSTCSTSTWRAWRGRIPRPPRRWGLSCTDSTSQNPRQFRESSPDLFPLKRKHMTIRWTIEKSAFWLIRPCVISKNSTFLQGLDLFCRFNEQLKFEGDDWKIIW